MSKRRFSHVSDEDIASSRAKQFAPNTNYNTNSAENSLREFYETLQNPSSSSYETLSPSQLNDLLERFYLSVRTKDNNEFKSTTMRTLRHNLSRALKSSHAVDIINDTAFTTSNTVLQNKFKQLKTIGKGSVQHHADITQADLKIIVGVLSPDNPTELQLLTWFYLQLYFCRRGVENQATLLKDHYSVLLIGDKKCIVQKHDELTKNHRENDTQRATGGIIAELQKHEKCPVAIFEKYQSKLNENCPYLWQLPIAQSLPNGPWYGKKTGINSIKAYMKKISEICNLSTIYTNHCVRATTCTLLAPTYSDIDIQSVSGHKSLSGLAQYKRINNAQKINMSETLSKTLGLNNNDMDDHQIDQTLDTQSLQSICDNDCLQSSPKADTNVVNLPSDTNQPSKLLPNSQTENINVNSVMAQVSKGAEKNFSFTSMFNNCNINSVNIHFNN